MLIIPQRSLRFGADFANLWGGLVKFLFGPSFPDPQKMYPDEAVGVIEYYERISRCSVNPCEGECGSAMPMFLLKSYSGKPECFFVDTENKEINRLCFFACYLGQREFYPYLEFGSISGHERPTEQPGNHRD